MRRTVSPPAVRSHMKRTGGVRFRSIRLLLKAMRHQLRVISPARPVAAVLIFIAILIAVVLVMQTPLAQLLSFSTSANKIIGETTIGTPLLSLPEPYGIGAPVMKQILPYVNMYLEGGSKYPDSLIKSTADPDHLHGKLIGHDPVTRQPLWTPTPFDFSKETKAMKRRHHAYTCFNRARSNSLPLDRPVPDVRPGACATQWYNLITPTPKPRIFELIGSLLPKSSTRASSPVVRLPGASILIMFYNEPLSPLLRTVHSVLDRSPPHLLHEIVLIDDGSDEAAPWLLPGGEFERHIQTLPKVRLARLRGRNGLMRARNIGAALANGEMLVFLDSHIEVTNNWLEPLTARVMSGVRDGIDRVVVPAIDNIEADTFKYIRGGIDVLGHTWGLGQTGVSNTSRALDATQEEEDQGIAPRRSPIMAGGLFALSREYFDRLGYYDPDMKIWGGEEMEISFRIWLCGGTLEWVPCSRVGHVFRSPKFWQGQVYKVPGEVVARNKWRASYWMDDFAQLAHLSMAPLKEDNGIGSLKFYDDIRKRLQCKPYRWYLRNVYPQMLASGEKLLGPISDSGSVGKVHNTFAAMGYVRNPAFKACLDHLHFKHDGAPFGVYPCHYLHGSQSLLMTKTGLLVSGDRLLEGCLTRENDDKVTQRRCADEMKTQQNWKLEAVQNGTEVQMSGGGKCLTVVQESEQENKSPFSLRMKPCGGTEAAYQAWSWEKSTFGSDSSFDAHPLN